MKQLVARPSHTGQQKKLNGIGQRFELSGTISRPEGVVLSTEDKCRHVTPTNKKKDRKTRSFFHLHQIQTIEFLGNHWLAAYSALNNTALQKFW